MWRIIGSMPNFTVHGKTMISAVMVPAAGSCEVRYQVGIGTDDQYFWVVGGRGDPDARCAASIRAALSAAPGLDGRGWCLQGAARGGDGGFERGRLAGRQGEEGQVVGPMDGYRKAALV